MILRLERVILDLLISVLTVVLSAAMQWLSMRTRKTGVVTSIPPCVTIIMPLVRNATGNHLIKSTSLGKLRALSLV